jgi:polysaccharide chain length determinant protein (PEP-CTERM system associated)
MKGSGRFMEAENTTRRELTPADYIAMLRRHWVLIAVLALVGPPIGYTVARFLPSRYVSQTLVLVQPPTVSDKVVPDMGTTTMNQELGSLKQQILSRSTLETVIKEHGLYAGDAKKTPIDMLVGRLQNAIDITSIAPLADAPGPKDLPGFTVSVTLDDAHKAQDVCTEITSMFIEKSNFDAQNRNDDLTQFLTQQLAESKSALDEQDAKLAEFKQRYFGSLPDDETANLNVLAALTTQFDDAGQALARAQQDKSFSETMLQQQLAALQATQTGQNPDTLEQQLATMKTQLANLEGTYKDDYPDVIKAKADITALEKRIADNNTAANAAAPTKETKTAVEPPQITQLRAQIHNSEQVITEKTKEQEQLKEQIGTYRGRIQQTPAVEQQFAELTRGHETALQAYNALDLQKHQAEMSGDLKRQQQGEYFRILDAANLPSTPSFPSRGLFTFGGLAAGLGLGLGLTFLMEFKDTSLKSERDVEHVLGLPLLAMIPDVEPVTSKKPISAIGLQPRTNAGISLGA